MEVEMKRVFNTKRELAEALLEGEKWKLGLVEDNPHQKLIDKFASGEYVCIYYNHPAAAWRKSDLNEPKWNKEVSYKLIHKDHEEVLEHWLNGGEVEQKTNEVQGWLQDLYFIRDYKEEYYYRIKPKQNKRLNDYFDQKDQDMIIDLIDERLKHYGLI